MVLALCFFLVIFITSFVSFLSESLYLIFDFYFIGQKNDALDNDEKIKTFSKIKSDLDIKEIIKKKLQHLYINVGIIEHG